MSEIIDTYKDYLYSPEYDEISVLLRIYEKQLAEYHIRIMTKDGYDYEEETKVKVKKLDHPILQKK